MEEKERAIEVDENIDISRGESKGDTSTRREEVLVSSASFFRRAEKERKGWTDDKE
jgi:hypothetical protein